MIVRIDSDKLDDMLFRLIRVGLDRALPTATTRARLTLAMETTEKVMEQVLSAQRTEGNTLPVQKRGRPAKGALPEQPTAAPTTPFTP